VLAEKSEAPDGRGAMLNAAIAAPKEDRKIRYRRSVRQKKQESLSNVKVSTRQQCVYEGP